MTIFDRRRLPASVFKLDAERMREGWYSDKYFENIVGMLTDLAGRKYGFGGPPPIWRRRHRPAAPTLAISRSRCSGSRAASRSR